MKNMMDILVNGISNAKTKTEEMELRILGLILLIAATDKKAQA